MKDIIIGGLGCLGIIFTLLKVAGFIYWSWAIVLFPFYIMPICIYGFIFIMLSITFLLGEKYE